ncbi:head GIN domain-containing protein [Hymenobacter koreensis]|uniref:Head GIN domain-containing protein n=1 Tax=Hymenobacter koreensis TaxID=1084523 RepID=A0ABP8IXU3_9BACT
MLLGLPAFRPATPVATAVSPSSFAAGREVREVAPFTELSLSTSSEVEVRQGATQRVEVEALAEDLAELETVVKNGRLSIQAKDHRGFNWRGFKGKVKVYVTMPQVNALLLSGSGKIRALDMVRTERLKLAVSGSGSLEAPVQAKQLTSSVSGSGSMRISGAAPSLAVHISGSGSIQAADLRSDAAEVHISGSGSCQIQASQTLDARIAGSGNVRYAGSPRITQRISGSGRVVRS